MSFLLQSVLFVALVPSQVNITTVVIQEGRDRKAQFREDLRNADVRMVDFIEVTEKVVRFVQEERTVMEWVCVRRGLFGRSSWELVERRICEIRPVEESKTKRVQDPGGISWNDTLVGTSSDKAGEVDFKPLKEPVGARNDNIERFLRNLLTNRKLKRAEENTGESLFISTEWQTEPGGEFEVQYRYGVGITSEKADEISIQVKVKRRRKVSAPSREDYEQVFKKEADDELARIKKALE